MQNSERQPFEQGWKSAFDGAEMSPPDSLWNSIEVEMSGSETAVMRRRVVFYQRIAAATLIFALSAGALAVYTYRGSKELAETPTTTSPEGTSPSPTDLAAEQSATSEASGTPSVTMQTETPPLAQSDIQVVKKTGKSTGNGQRPGTSQPSPVIPPMMPGIDDKPDDVPQVAAVDTEVKFSAPGTESEKSEMVVDQTAKEQQVAELKSADEINAIAEAQSKEEKKRSKDMLSPWLGVGGAAGSYSPQADVGGGSADRVMASPSSGFSSSNQSNTPQSIEHNIGSAYSAGVSGGIKLAKRWVLQSGLNYVNQQVDYTTNFVGYSDTNQAMAMTSEYMNSKSVADVMVTNAYEVSSKTEILSIPVQAGFLIVDRKFGWQLNSGVSTDFFLRNTLADKSGTRDKISEGGGDSSPYRAVNVSGLFNTEVSYKIGQHYRIALVPGIRYSFQPILKSQSTGAPLVVDVGFRFKYLFN